MSGPIYRVCLTATFEAEVIRARGATKGATRGNTGGQRQRLYGSKWYRRRGPATMLGGWVGHDPTSAYTHTQVCDVSQLRLTRCVRHRIVPLFSQATAASLAINGVSGCSLNPAISLGTAISHAITTNLSALNFLPVYRYARVACVFAAIL